MFLKFQDYSVMEFLGKGGFASVYRAIHKATGGEVAIKMVNIFGLGLRITKLVFQNFNSAAILFPQIDKKVIKAWGLTERVRQEVSIHSRLKHPSILELLWFFEDENYVYLILELCHGGEIQNYLRQRGGRLAEKEGEFRAMFFVFSEH
jgi:polo-like kinase 4